MKNLSGIIVILSILSFTCLITDLAHAESCDVEKVIGAKVSQGTYRVSVTRESQNMYKVTSQDIYIKTKYCYEYSYSQDAILEIESSSGSYIYGKLHFLN